MMERVMETTVFMVTLIEKSRANIPYATDQHAAIVAAIDEAHAQLSDAAFFTMIDWFGGLDALIEVVGTLMY